MPGVREDWFPTSIWYFQHPEPAALNAELLRLIREEQQRDTTGLTDRSSVLGWHSAVDLQQRPEYAGLMKLVRENALEVAQFLHWDFAQGDLYTLNCWAIVNGKLASNAMHNHPHSILSGVYYVQADENSGHISFRDPREGPVLTAPPYAQLTPWTFQSTRYQPVPGRMLIFPSWLYHQVEPNLSERERVSISFNLGFR